MGVSASPIKFSFKITGSFTCTDEMLTLNSSATLFPPVRTQTRIQLYSHVLPQGHLHLKFAHDTKFLLPTCCVSTRKKVKYQLWFSNVYVSKNDVH